MKTRCFNTFLLIFCSGSSSQCYKIFENRLKQSSTKFPRKTRSHTSGPAALGSVVSIEVVRSRRCLHAQRRPGSNGVRCCTRRRNACPTEDSVRYGPGTGRSHAAEAWFRAHVGYHTRTRPCSKSVVHGPHTSGCPVPNTVPTKSQPTERYHRGQPVGCQQLDSRRPPLSTKG